MLLEFSVENYECFRDEAYLSMVLPSLKTQVPKNGQTWEETTSRVAAIFGANASGKSTIIRALVSLNQAIRRPGERLYYPYLLQNPPEPQTTYTLSFTHEQVRYDYRVQADKRGAIALETMHAYPKGTARLLFERRTQEDSTVTVKAGPSLKGATREVNKITQPDQLFLAVARQYGHESLAPIAQTLTRSFSLTNNVSSRRKNTVTLMRQVLDNIGQWERYLSVLAQVADIGITHIEVDRQELPPKLIHAIEVRDAAGVYFHPSDEDMLEGANAIFMYHRGTNGKESRLGLNAQSDGTLSWLALVSRAVVALQRGITLVVDELDSSLHPTLAAELVSMFKNPEVNKNGAQLIFNSHDATLLGNIPMRLLDPPEVWFTEKNDEGASDIFSLEEFDTRPKSNIQKQYLTGAFGAIPTTYMSELRALLEAEQ